MSESLNHLLIHPNDLFKTLIHSEVSMSESLNHLLIHSNYLLKKTDSFRSLYE